MTYACVSGCIVYGCMFYEPQDSASRTCIPKLKNDCGLWLLLLFDKLIMTISKSFTLPIKIITAVYAPIIKLRICLTEHVQCVRCAHIKDMSNLSIKNMKNHYANFPHRISFLTDRTAGLN